MKLAASAQKHAPKKTKIGFTAFSSWAVASAMALVLLATFALVARADDSASPSADNPYVGIPIRNAFNLVPIPTNAPVETAPPDPPSKITPNGIMSLFGTPQVLFKVAVPPKPGQPPSEQSYVMSEGDREDGISVIKIDQQAGVIIFDNHGITQKIPLVPVTDSGGGGGGGPGGGRGPGGFGGFHPHGMGGFANNSGGYGGGGGAAPDSSSSSPGSSPDGSSPSSGNGGGVSPTSFEGAQAKLNSIINDPNHLTPEAQVIMMEANRQTLQAQGDDSAPLIPPTEITDPGGSGSPGP